MNIIDYSDKSFIVFGEHTKTYSKQLRELGGRFNRYLKPRENFSGGPGWIFKTAHKPNVSQFVDQISTGVISHHVGIPLQGEQITLPTTFAPIKKYPYQNVKWKVFRPRENMIVEIKAGGNLIEGKVQETETHKDFVDTVWIKVKENTSKLVICNGQWQVWGWMIEHTVFFKDQSEVELDI